MNLNRVNYPYRIINLLILMNYVRTFEKYKYTPKKHLVEVHRLEAAKLYRTLSSPERLRLLNHLRDSPLTLTEAAKTYNISLVEARRDLQILVENGLVQITPDRRYKLTTVGSFMSVMSSCLDTVLKRWSEFEWLIDQLPLYLTPCPMALEGLEAVKDPYHIFNAATKIVWSARRELNAMNITSLIPFLNSYTRKNKLFEKVELRFILPDQKLELMYYDFPLISKASLRFHNGIGDLMVIVNEKKGMIVDSTRARIGLISSTFVSYSLIRKIFEYFWNTSKLSTTRQSFTGMKGELI